MPAPRSLSNLASALRISVVLLLAVALLAGCAGYYLQAAAGQASLMRARVPMEDVLADPATPMRWMWSGVLRSVRRLLSSIMMA